jgi:Fe-S cluster biogenesis protein NfuA
VSDVTLKGAVQAKLRELVDPDIVVEDVGERLNKS